VGSVLHCWLRLIPYEHIIGSCLGDVPILQRQRNEVVANSSAIIWDKDHKDQMSEITDIQDFFDRLQFKVSLNVYCIYVALKFSFIRIHQNMSSTIRLLHLYSGEEKVYHSQYMLQLMG
jgi:hypothetical protein